MILNYKLHKLRIGGAAVEGRIVTGSIDLIRQLNRSLVLDVIRRKGPISRADVKRLLGLNFTTVTNAVTDLAAEGLVLEVGLGTSRGGRKPLLLTLNPTSRYVLGCELQSTRLVVGLFDLMGKRIGQIAQPKSPSMTPEVVVQRIRESVDQLLATHSIPIEKVEGVGVAAPGPLNSSTGVLRQPPNMIGWRNVPLRQLLEEALQLPVIVEKDGNAAALGEVWFGAGKEVQNLIFMIVDAGIGAGIITDGKLYRGSQSGAGEIGHITLDLDGPLCSCGNYGCLEAIASGFALVRKAGEAVRRGVRSQLQVVNESDSEAGLASLLEAAREGDKLAEDLMDECGRTVGIAMANTVNMYNPELIVVGGRLAQESPRVLERARELARQKAFSVLAEDVKIVPTALGEGFLVVGAAALIFAKLFQGPVALA